uniref:G071 VD Superfamily M precursor conopeptide n=1 Tax=Conus geographus TaxID=6491 RepID=X5IWR1_CONGE|nr:G071_VD_Superfamily_M_precursor_conopeptide [Conus geographus]
MMSKLGVLLTICLLLFPLLLFRWMEMNLQTDLSSVCRTTFHLSSIPCLRRDEIVALRRRNAKTDNANPRDVALDDNVLMTNFITATSSV